ncbi:MAG TPA: SDR family NAD(P)-dependent oxidoreductase [Kineosporiaceae bacterium]|nr:SDR family NAD(P)-dependent oxidoreductase [Kineosporiaceae bacterium]
MLKGIAGRTAIVTGAGGRIGAAVCRRLRIEGAQVVAVDSNKLALDALAAELIAEFGGDQVTVQADVSDPDDTERFFATAVERFGSVDLFHANAGIEGVVSDVAHLDIADVDRVLAVNVRSVFLGAAAAVRQMSEQPTRGNILFTSSIAGLKGDAGVAPYVASKHAVIGIMRSLTKEIGPLGIRVNCLCPGVVESRMMDSLETGIGALAGMDSSAVKTALLAAVPMHRYAQVDEIAATAAWLLSDEVPYMHGEVVTVGGGLYP